jgi:hypothetical protein
LCLLGRRSTSWADYILSPFYFSHFSGRVEQYSYPFLPHSRITSVCHQRSP